MTLHEVSDIMQRTPLGTFLLVTGFLIFGLGILSKEKLKKLDGLLWVFGLLARFVDSHRSRAIQVERASSERVIQVLQADLAEVKARQASFEQELHDYRDWDVWVAAVFHGLEIWAAREGHELPPPPLMTKAEWLAWRKTPTNRSPYFCGVFCEGGGFFLRSGLVFLRCLRDYF